MTVQKSISVNPPPLPRSSPPPSPQGEYIPSSPPIHTRVFKDTLISRSHQKWQCQSCTHTLLSRSAEKPRPARLFRASPPPLPPPPTPGSWVSDLLHPLPLTQRKLELSFMSRSHQKWQCRTLLSRSWGCASGYLEGETGFTDMCPPPPSAPGKDVHPYLPPSHNARQLCSSKSQVNCTRSGNTVPWLAGPWPGPAAARRGRRAD